MSADTGKKMEKRPKASLCCSLTPYHFTPKACTNKAFKVFPKTQKTASYTPCNRKIIHTLNAAIIALRATFFLQLYTETLAPSVVCFPWFSLLVSTCPAVVSGPQVSPYRWSGCLFFSTRLVLWYVYVLFFFRLGVPVKEHLCLYSVTITSSCRKKVLFIRWRRHTGSQL